MVNPPPLLHLLFSTALILTITIMCSTYSLCLTSISPSDMVQNSVRRQGVDSSLLKYTILALDQQTQDQNPSPSDSTVYTINLSPSLGGITAQARRIASSSALQQQGLTFNQFSLPPGSPSIRLTISSSSATDAGGASDDVDGSAPLLLIYRRIFNFTIYTLPPSYTFAGPIVGIIAYSPPNFTAIDPSLPQLTITTSTANMITVHSPRYSSLPSTAPVPLCALFALNGSISFSPLADSPNVCEFGMFGDVALVVPWPQENTSSTQPGSEANNPSSPSPSSSSSPTSSSSVSSSTNSRPKSNTHWKLALGVTCLTLAGIAFCVVVVISSIGIIRRLKVAILARFTGNEEALQTSLIGVSRAPTAAGVRTKPTLEMDMARFE